MPLSPSSSAHQARAALAERLRELRLDAGITGKELAARCGWSVAKSSRIENARTAPSDADIRAWCTACGADAQAPDLVAANRQADSAYVQWKRLQRSGLKRLQESSIPLWERTRLFRTYCSHVVPGILQTPGYATAMLSSIARFRGTPDDVIDAVDARMRRTHVMRDGAHVFVLLIEESVLRYRLGNTDVMVGQMGNLLAAMSLPSVSIGVIPSTADREHAMWPLEAFTIFDGDQVQVELLSASVTVTAPDEIELYARAFEALRGMAVYGAEARALVMKAIDALS
ncbi:helix-turn-helix domain-containing protein [Streptomyces odonnellii]|uniref:helix-turn-helix domain-containing protein n=1 Tax=Streptomyces odonnellii TaxID=1417980 RepID=UPI00062603F5|nr:helix-turn-helix transcriptional regulator [Streptomyces odonnellii]